MAGGLEFSKRERMVHRHGVGILICISMDKCGYDRGESDRIR